MKNKENNIIKVTIIMPLLNSIEYLRECMDSVVNQTLRDIEIICIDAGSTDGTLEVLKEYASSDERITIIKSDKKSYGYQVNLGLDNARGEYFGIVESDDFIKPKMYETLYNIARSHNCDAVKSDFCIFVDEGNKRKFTYRPLTNISELYGVIKKPIDDLRMFRAYLINTPGIYKLKFIKENKIRLNETLGASYQDNGLWFQIFSLADSIYLLKEAFYMVRRDNPNSSVKNREKVYCMCEEYDFIRNFLSNHKDIERKLAPVCAYCRFANYWATLERIDDKYKLEFCFKFSDDIKKIKKNGELIRNFYSQKQWDNLSAMFNPEKYYFLNYYRMKLLEEVTDKDIFMQNLYLKYKLDDLENKINANYMLKRNHVVNKTINNCIDYGLKDTVKKIVKKIIPR